MIDGAGCLHATSAGAQAELTGFSRGYIWDQAPTQATSFFKAVSRSRYE